MRLRPGSRPGIAGAVDRRHVALARERQHPVDYWRHTYYENWLAGLEKILIEKGVVTAEELASGRAAGPASQNLATVISR